MRVTLYLIVRYYPISHRHEIGIYSTQCLAFYGEQPIDILLGSETDVDYESAKKKLIERFSASLS